jgi:quercetin dioxygenase-like cupin family protein
MGAKNFAMRIFELEPKGHSPLHKHPWEHEIFILEGEGQIFDGEKAMPLRAGAVIFVQANDIHQFSASGKKI